MKISQMEPTRRIVLCHPVTGRAAHLGRYAAISKLPRPYHWLSTADQEYPASQGVRLR